MRTSLGASRIDLKDVTNIACGTKQWLKNSVHVKYATVQTFEAWRRNEYFKR